MVPWDTRVKRVCRFVAPDTTRPRLLRVVHGYSIGIFIRNGGPLVHHQLVN